MSEKKISLLIFFFELSGSIPKYGTAFRVKSGKNVVPYFCAILRKARSNMVRRIHMDRTFAASHCPTLPKVTEVVQFQSIDETIEIVYNYPTSYQIDL